MPSVCRGREREREIRRIAKLHLKSAGKRNRSIIIFLEEHGTEEETFSNNVRATRGPLAGGSVNQLFGEL